MRQIPNLWDGCRVFFFFPHAASGEKCSAARAFAVLPLGGGPGERTHTQRLVLLRFAFVDGSRIIRIYTQVFCLLHQTRPETRRGGRRHGHNRHPGGERWGGGSVGNRIHGLHWLVSWTRLPYLERFARIGPVAQGPNHPVGPWGKPVTLSHSVLRNSGGYLI